MTSTNESATDAVAAWTDGAATLPPLPTAAAPRRRTPGQALIDAAVAAEAAERAQREFDEFFAPRPAGPPTEIVIGVPTW